MTVLAALIDFFAGNLWRSAAIALLLIVLGQGVALRIANADRDVAVAKAAASSANEQATAVRWEVSALEALGELAECQRGWDDLTRRSATAVQTSAAARLEAEAKLAEYQHTYRERSQHCGAALLDAERACPELGDY